MGWSWATHPCQGVLRNSIAGAGLSADFLIEDGRAGVHLSCPQQVGSAAHVDDFFTVGHDRDKTT
eukprot:4248909-Pyramimonas_sp.AAC.1